MGQLPVAVCATLILVLAQPGCRSDAASVAPATPAATSGPVLASPSPASGTAAPAAPAVLAPTGAECVALWDRYHALAPTDPYVERDSFVARCGRSTREVLTCPDRARAEVVDIVRQGHVPADSGSATPPEAQMVHALLPGALPSRAGICMTRERVRFALGTGELETLGLEVAAGHLRPDVDGVVVAPGTLATLPALGMIERERTVAFSPPGELRVSRRPDGRVWLYVLGGLLGRHQNQVGFLYSSGPFLTQDFASEAEGRESVCIAPNEEGQPLGHGRYLLPCFTVITRLAPQLLEVGSAPD